MHVDIMRGFGVTRRRGTETGGLLLGYATDEPARSITVVDFEPVPCEYAFGPSYILSEADHATFAEVAARWLDPGVEQRAIGYFRSHTREGLSLDKSDAELFEQYLSSSGKLALLVKPYATRNPTASLFIPSQGRLSVSAAPMEFPFSPTLTEVTPELPPVPSAAKPAPDLSSTLELPPLIVPDSVPQPVRDHAQGEALLTVVQSPRAPAPRAPETEPAQRIDSVVVQPRSSGQTGSWVTSALVTLFGCSAVALGFVGGYQAAGGSISVYPALRMTAPTAETPFELGLRARTQSDRVLLRWSADSFAARNATAGTVIIEENNTAVTQSLSEPELRGGSILHLPTADQVRFRLELTLPGDRSATESVAWQRAAP